MATRSAPSAPGSGLTRPALLLLSLALVACPAPPAPRPPPVAAHDPVWFGDLGAPPRVSAADAASALRAVAAALAGAPLAVPPAWSGDREPRIAILSASDGAGPARVAVGRGRGLGAALTAAVDRLRASGGATTWLKLDLVGRVGPPVELRDGGQVGFERSLEGLASLTPGLLVALPEQLVAGDLVARDGTFDCAAVADFLADRDPRAAAELRSRGRLWGHHFATTGYLLTGDRVTELYRGHPRSSGAATADSLLAAARAAGDYLVGAVAEDGSFAYTYRSHRDRVDDDYNMVRHAGTVYAMLELYRVAPDPALLAAAERALDRLLGAVTDYGEPGAGQAVMHYGGKIKLGGVALTALAVIEHIRATGSRRHLDTARRLCRYLIGDQLSTGEFVHQRLYPSGRVRDFTSEYYPGEALFALVRMYQVDPDPSWLDAAERGAGYLIAVRDRGLGPDRLIHDHWFLYALAELYPERPRDRYLDHALLIAEAIRRAQRRSAEWPDYVGSYGDPPRTTPAATRSEGLLAAYRLARAYRPDRAAALLDAVRLGVGFQLATQIGPARALYLPRPRRALGGFTSGLSDFEIRIDYVQHNLSALLALRRALLDRDREPARAAER